MGLKIDYIIALTSLYGLVHKEKVTEIYNMQNDGNVEAADMDNMAKNHVDELRENFVELYGDYYVHEAIMEFDEFEQELSKRKNKPFYIPNQQELLKYKEDLYFERTKEYKALKKYAQKNFFNGNAYKAELLCEDVHDECQLGFSLDNIFSPFEWHGIEFESEGQVREVMELVINLSNNVRLQENNGFTSDELRRQTQPNEAFHEGSKPGMGHNPSGATNQGEDEISSKKVGRNDPCPCGSGKKYKKCCGA